MELQAFYLTLLVGIFDRRQQDKQVGWSMDGAKIECKVDATPDELRIIFEQIVEELLEYRTKKLQESNNPDKKHLHYLPLSHNIFRL